MWEAVGTCPRWQKLEVRDYSQNKEPGFWGNWGRFIHLQHYRISYSLLAKLLLGKGVWGWTEAPKRGLGLDLDLKMCL